MQAQSMNLYRRGFTAMDKAINIYEATDAKTLTIRALTISAQSRKLDKNQSLKEDPFRQDKSVKDYLTELIPILINSATSRGKYSLMVTNIDLDIKTLDGIAKEVQEEGYGVEITNNPGSDNYNMKINW